MERADDRARSRGWRACCRARRRRPRRRRRRISTPRGARPRSFASGCGTPDTGTLLRRYRDGHAEIDGYAEDYAYLIFGLLELFQADADPAWLEWAIALQRRQDELFWDDAGGGWFSTTGRDPSVLLRMKEDYDGAEPTASSVSVLNLLVLSHLVDDRSGPSGSSGRCGCSATRLEQMGRGVPMMAAALSDVRSPACSRS